MKTVVELIVLFIGISVQAQPTQCTLSKQKVAVKAMQQRLLCEASTDTSCSATVYADLATRLSQIDAFLNCTPTYMPQVTFIMDEHATWYAAQTTHFAPYCLASYYRYVGKSIAGMSRCINKTVSSSIEISGCQITAGGWFLVNLGKLQTRQFCSYFLSPNSLPDFTKQTYFTVWDIWAIL